MTKSRSGRAGPDVVARANLELAERLGPWSLRWQEAQDNAARSRAARYQSMADHLGRMSTLANECSWRILARGPKGGSDRSQFADQPRSHGSSVRSMRGDLTGSFTRSFSPGCPSMGQGVAVTHAEQVEIADRIDDVIMDEAIERFPASPRQDDMQSINGLLAERLGFWSDLWRQSQDVTARDRPGRSLADGDRSASVASAEARAAGPSGPAATLRLHLELNE